jgi:hypothetical protein
MGEKTISVRKSKSGIVTIKSGGYVESIDVRMKTPPQKFEAVRWAILTAGFVFTEDIEKMVRNELGM